MLRNIDRVILLVAVFSISSSASADVALNATTAGKAAFINIGGEGVTQIKGNRMRTEQKGKGDSQILIIDIAARQFVSLEPKKKTALVTPLDTISEQLQKAGLTDIKATIKPTTETKTIAGYACTVHEVNASFPFSMTGQPNDGMDFTMVLSGTACLSRDAPGVADYQRFYKAAADSGFIFGDPHTTKSPAAAAQARAYAAMVKSMTEAGMALESKINMTATGTGPMAAMMSGLAKSDINSTVTQVSDGALGDDQFSIPADYKVKTQK